MPKQLFEFCRDLSQHLKPIVQYGNQARYLQTRLVLITKEAHFLVSQRSQVLCPLLMLSLRPINSHNPLAILYPQRTQNSRQMLLVNLLKLHLISREHFLVLDQFIQQPPTLSPALECCAFELATRKLVTRPVDLLNSLIRYTIFINHVIYFILHFFQTLLLFHFTIIPLDLFNCRQQTTALTLVLLPLLRPRSPVKVYPDRSRTNKRHHVDLVLIYLLLYLLYHQMLLQSHELIQLSHIFLLLFENRPLCLRCLAHRTLRCLLNPLCYAFLVVAVLTIQLYQLLIFLELTIANRAKILLSFLFACIVALVFASLQILNLLFREPLILVGVPSCHHLQHSEEVGERGIRVLIASPSTISRKALRLYHNNLPPVIPSPVTFKDLKPILVIMMMNISTLPSGVHRAHRVHKQRTEITERIVVLLILFDIHPLHPSLSSLVSVVFFLRPSINVPAYLVMLCHQTFREFIAALRTFLLSVLALQGMGVKFCESLEISTEMAWNFIHFFLSLRLPFLKNSGSFSITTFLFV